MLEYGSYQEKKYRSLGQMKENLVNTGGCIQNNCLDVFCIAVHCIIKVSDPGPSWPSCYLTGPVFQEFMLPACCLTRAVFAE